MKNLFLIWGVIVGFLFLSCETQKDTLVKDAVQTENGWISGTYNELSGITSFKGIPFAAPPVGDLRWKAPHAAGSWDGVKKCNKFSASPVQGTPVPFSMWTQEFIAPQEPLNEDCLYLNVWTGAEKAGENRPVLVYIYGGGFSSGSGAVSVYNGEEMAKKGVVFLTVNYRVGVFGFLAHPELSAESEYNASGNYGLLDQIAALQWVNRNIEAFGGDPNKVTIAGQSAGAFSVNYLLASPLTKGLIHRAIAESGGAVLPTNKLARGNTLESAEQAGVKYAESLDANSVAELREKTAEEILAVRGPSAPIVDGYVIPKPMNEIFALGNQNDVPLILGWNQDEGFGGPPQSAEKFREQIKQQFGNEADKFLALFPLSTDEEAKEVQNDLGSIQSFGIQSYKWMNYQNETATSKVYIYRFERDLPYGEGMEDYGAFHTGEVPYAYNNLKMSPRPWKKEDYKLADIMSDYWVSFAEDGNPNCEELPEWQACAPENLKAMIFDLNVECKDLPNKEILSFLDNYYSNQ
ncbi:carboxylesterase family protein [Maribellus comscasis]|uniref:Carboxylic ester hydrolase n=1 Tax=Maribellus comscasis TaxID=2681766 RepID=A0A6I6JRH2_9BACT|nr:carboxylesterase family protein [Maribellus comscasis]QGY42757.1 carboxylesterase family protein [Maribellus comscasis]